jgi:hypothetical protein
MCVASGETCHLLRFWTWASRTREKFVMTRWCMNMLCNSGFLFSFATWAVDMGFGVKASVGVESRRWLCRHMNRNSNAKQPLISCNVVQMFVKR